MLCISADSLKATRAMVILGLLLAAGALVCFLLRQFMLKDKDILNKIAAGLAIAAGMIVTVHKTVCLFLIYSKIVVF